MDTHSYKGWLNSDNFLKRSFGIFFYYFFANMLISTIFGFIFIVIILATGFLNPLFDAFKMVDEYKTTNSIESAETIIDNKIYR